LLRSLTAAEGLEKYLGNKYVGQKRFSLEGGETMIAALDATLEHCADLGVEEIVLVEQEWPEIFVARRSDNWKRHHYTMMDSSIELASIGMSIKVADFYQSNPFPEDTKRPFYLRFREDG